MQLATLESQDIRARLGSQSWGEQTVSLQGCPRLLLRAGLPWGLPSRAAGHPGLLTHNGGGMPSGEGPKQEVGSLLPKVESGVGLV